MNLFLAGNFPQLSSVEKEQKMAEYIIKTGSDYHRLMTFFYVKKCDTVLTVAKNLSKPKKLIKRNYANK